MAPRIELDRDALAVADLGILVAHQRARGWVGEPSVRSSVRYEAGEGILAEQRFRHAATSRLARETRWDVF